ncbi:hypothetical protein [Pseudomonas aeruginosa]|uniref:hypothetical protein n=1 Tax=Pseudomonas aeruginosa TaxID=287 RepID=UPI0021A6B4E3|nr:hypothetical protein [Pseudomonas aeruginosa]UWU64934.1 hypothetical protein NDR95_13535 [Pseudomonas aeruginosa]
MAFLFASGDPRGEPKLTLEQDEFGKWEWRVWCPLGARPERQAQAYALAERLNSPTGRLRKHRHESLPPRTEEFMRGIVKEVVMSEVKRYIIGRNGLPEFHDSGEYVATSDYDALAAKLAMAEDAAAKGDAARQQCGGMEMEIQELREQAAKLAEFAQEIISGALEGGSFDGTDIQESAERHGLIAKQVMNEPCRGPEEYCACAWSTSFPTECYRITAELRALLNQDKENGNG